MAIKVNSDRQAALGAAWILEYESCKRRIRAGGDGSFFGAIMLLTTW